MIVGSELSSSSGASKPSTNLLITALPAESTEETVLSIFRAYGTVTGCKMLPDNAHGKVALVCLASIEQATWICSNLHGNIPLGLTTPVAVAFAESVLGDGYGKAPVEQGTDSRVAPY